MTARYTVFVDDGPWRVVRVEGGLAQSVDLDFVPGSDAQQKAEAVAKRLDGIAEETERGWSGSIGDDGGLRLERTVRRAPFDIRLNTAFDAVVAACQEAVPSRPSTWINHQIRAIYGELHRIGPLEARHLVERRQPHQRVRRLHHRRVEEKLHRIAVRAEGRDRVSPQHRLLLEQGELVRVPVEFGS